MDGVWRREFTLQSHPNRDICEGVFEVYSPCVLVCVLVCLCPDGDGVIGAR